MGYIGLRDLFILALCTTAHFFYRRRRRNLIPLPPGPPRWPIIGNAFSMPLQSLPIFYKRLGERLGTKIMYLEAFGRPFLILNDLEMAQDLLEKRSALYSSRPRLPMLQDVIGANNLFVTMPYGDEWRLHRRMFQQYFSERNLSFMQDRVLEFLRKSLLPNLCQHPNELDEHMRNYIGGFAISITYGLPVQRRHDQLLQRFEKSQHDISGALSPGKYLVNIIPILKYVPSWMPGAAFQTAARGIRERFIARTESSYNASLNLIGQGTARHCFVENTLDKHYQKPDFERQAFYTKHTAAQVFGALSETTINATMTFILAMLQNPHVQRRAQQEVDLIVGRDRLPEFSDIPRLEYFRAVIKEVFRWNPVAPVGIPHMTSDEDVYKGYYIPKGCTIMANTYAMLHDDDIFPDPTQFKPERFLKPDGSIRDDLLDPEHIATFGFGRRICPGKQIALCTLHITAASILHLFDISPALDEKGSPIDVKPAFVSDSIVSGPVPFKCKIAPREGKDIDSLLQDYFGSEPI